jgi:PAP2 superfamily
MVANDRPGNLPSTLGRFGSDEQCRCDRFAARCPERFRCAACCNDQAWALKSHLVYECAACGRRHSIRDGTEGVLVAERPYTPLAHAAGMGRRRAVLVCLGAGVAAFSGIRRCLSRQLAHASQTPTDDGSRRGQVLATIYWNQLARELVGSHKIDPPQASRLYALLSIAQHDAAWSERDANGDNGSEVAASDYLRRLRIEGASRTILSALLPGDLEYISEFRFRDSYPTLPSEALESAYRSGGATALQLLKKRQNDGSDEASELAPPAGSYVWRSFQNKPPVRPWWGYVRPLAVKDIADFIPAMPPLDAEALDSALAEVRRASSNATAHQRELIQAWADGPGTYTPPGHWNAIAAGLIEERRRTEVDAARVLSLCNIAMMDAGIACWRAKYTYWLARPSQLDSTINPLIPVPNFPSYTSGHSAFSAAAASVLEHMFPEEKASLRMMAEQAAISRLHAGIHFSFDVREGMLQGKRIANSPIDWYGSPSPLLPRIM